VDIAIKIELWGWHSIAGNILLALLHGSIARSVRPSLRGYDLVRESFDQRKAYLPGNFSLKPDNSDGAGAKGMPTGDT
jgi:hypothetical protein